MAKQLGRRIVLGINAAHDASACLLIDGELVVAVAEERLSRRKHDRGFPQRAVGYCLETVDGGIEAVAAIVLNESVRTDYGLMLQQDPRFSGILIVNPSHHLLHAYYAIVASGMQRAAILVLDGSGYSYGEHQRHCSPLLGPAPPYSEMEEAESSYQIGTDGEITLIEKRWGLWEASAPLVRFPSLGHMYSAASQYIFGHIDHSGKTMGLAAYGDVSFFPEPIVHCESEGLTIDTHWSTRLPPRSSLPAHLDPVCRNIAAKVQAELEKGVVFLCRRLHEKTGLEDLCLSGGVGLNSVANARILRETGFRRLFVAPAAGDSGISIGAALYGDHQLTGKRPGWRTYHNFHGKDYSACIAATIEEYRGLILPEVLPSPELAAARDIAEGKFVGWIEGGSEFGPRALGHRSILCDPRPDNMRDRLNAEVKFREPFRPYAASVLTEYASDYFELAADDPFMMTVATIVEDKREVIPSVSHFDGSCRIQTVGADYPGKYRRLIECFHKLTGVPLVLNTSFNVRGEPIVETPADAVRCFLSSNLHVLYLLNYRITKIDVMSWRPEDPIPYLNEFISLHSSIEFHAGAALEPQYCYRTRTGYQGRLSFYEYDFLMRIDGKRSILELQRLLSGDWSAFYTFETAKKLQRRGVISFRDATSSQHLSECLITSGHE